MRVVRIVVGLPLAIVCGKLLVDAMRDDGSDELGLGLVLKIVGGVGLLAGLLLVFS